MKRSYSGVVRGGDVSDVTRAEAREHTGVSRKAKDKREKREIFTKKLIEVL
jgi:hypothetical protein